MNKPFLPTDRPTSTRTRSISRGLACLALAKLQKIGADKILRTHWPHDDLADLVVKAAQSPTSRLDFESASASKWLFLAGLAPQSVAIRLFEAGPRLDMEA